MRHIWIDLGSPIEVDKLQRLGITRTYCDSRSPEFHPAFERGIYRAQNWDGSGASEFAIKLSADVKQAGGDPYRQLAVHANIEIHDSGWIMAFLTAWRVRRPKRETTIVIEGNQAGWFTPELTHRINLDPNLTVMAEAYTGDMGGMDADSVRSNLTNYGIRREKAEVMYDAARLQQFWDGCAFTQQRLP